MMYSSAWPWWLRVLVIAAVTLVAVASMWGQLRDSKILRAVARELLLKEGEGDDAAVDAIAAQRHPAGETVKSQVNKAADDSKSTLDALNSFKQEYHTRHEALENRVGALEAWRKRIDGVVGNG